MSKPGIAATSIYMKRNTHLSLYWLAAWRLWWGSMPSLKTTSSAFPVLCLCSLSYCRSACFLALLSEFLVLPWEHVQRTQHRGLRLKSCFTLAFLVQFPELPINSRELLFFFLLSLSLPFLGGVYSLSGLFGLCTLFLCSSSHFGTENVILSGHQPLGITISNLWTTFPVYCYWNHLFISSCLLPLYWHLFLILWDSMGLKASSTAKLWTFTIFSPLFSLFKQCYRWSPWLSNLPGRTDRKMVVEWTGALPG